MDIGLRIIHALIILMPCLASPMMVYFLDQVLKYEMRHRKGVYICSFIIAGLAGISFLLFGGYYGQIKKEFAASDVLSIVLSLFMMFVIGFNLKDKWWKRILIVFLSTGIITNINYLFSVLREELSLTFLIESEFRSALGHLIYEIIVLALEFMFFVALAHLRKKRDDVPLPLPMTVIIFIVLELFTSNISYDIYDENYMSEDHSTAIMVMVLLLAFMLLLFYARVARKERNDLADLNRRNAEYIEAETKYFELSAKSDDKIRAMRHDMKNNIQVLMLLLEHGEYDKMREFLEEMGGDLTATDVSAHTGNTIADAIIADKQRKASAAGSELRVNGTISGVDFTPVDLCKILANILDNAIEAVSVEEFYDVAPELKMIELTFRKTDKFFMISVTNPCVDCPVIVDGKIETNKNDKKNHGFGLANAREAASNYGGELSVDCNQKSGRFIFRTEVLFSLED